MAKVPGKPKLDLTKYEWRIAVRPLRIEDFDALVAMQTQCFPGMKPWALDQIESQLAIFPEGQLCVEVDGQIAASSGSLILEFDPNLAWHDWRVVADASLPASSPPGRSWCSGCTSPAA
jgi:hypothetical protein